MARIVFMGTPEFATPILAALVDNHEIAAVYTRADKPAGRGRQISQSPVKVLALQRGLAVEQPLTLRSEQAQTRLREYRPELIVVAAFGLILPERVLDIPPKGSINTHASLLPRWRGASPISAAILAGDVETGVTLMQMDAGVDTGPVIAFRRLSIDPDDTTGTLTERLSSAAAELLLESLDSWLDGGTRPFPQAGEPSSTRMVRKEDGLIDWNRPALEIERAVRAYNPWPTAYTFIHSAGHGQPASGEGQLLKIWRATVSTERLAEPPGKVVELDSWICVSTGKGALCLREVQLAGRRAMSVDDFVKGQRSFVGSMLGTRA